MIIQQTTQKLSRQEIELEAQKMQDKQRKERRDYCKNLCFELARNDIQDFSDIEYIRQEYYSQLGMTKPIMLELEKMHEYGLKQWLRMKLFNLRYDSFISNLLDSIAR